MFTAHDAQEHARCNVGKDPIFGSDQERHVPGHVRRPASPADDQGHGLGLADMLVRQLQRGGLRAPPRRVRHRHAGSPAPGRASGCGGTSRRSATRIEPLPPVASACPSAAQTVSFASALAQAQQAARAARRDPCNLIAQAALETNWGRSVPRGAGGATQQQSLRRQGQLRLERRHRHQPRPRNTAAAARPPCKAPVPLLATRRPELPGLCRAAAEQPALSARARHGQRRAGLRHRRCSRAATRPTRIMPASSRAVASKLAGHLAGPCACITAPQVRRRAADNRRHGTLKGMNGWPIFFPPASPGCSRSSRRWTSPATTSPMPRPPATASRTPNFAEAARPIHRHGLHRQRRRRPEHHAQLQRVLAAAGALLASSYSSFNTLVDAGGADRQHAERLEHRAHRDAAELRQFAADTRQLPTSTAARQALLSRRRRSRSRSRRYDSQIIQSARSSRRRSAATSPQINTLAEQHRLAQPADRRRLAVPARRRTSCMDQRDQLINQLSQYVIGEHRHAEQRLAERLHRQRPGAGHRRHGADSCRPSRASTTHAARHRHQSGGGSTADITSEITGGELGGLLSCAQPGPRSGAQRPRPDQRRHGDDRQPAAAVRHGP